MDLAVGLLVLLTSPQGLGVGFPLVGPLVGPQCLQEGVDQDTLGHQEAVDTLGPALAVTVPMGLSKCALRPMATVPPRV